MVEKFALKMLRTLIIILSCMFIANLIYLVWWEHDIQYRYFLISMNIIIAMGIGYFLHTCKSFKDSLRELRERKRNERRIQ